jgi:threonine-phosphate decarboxylase
MKEFEHGGDINSFAKKLNCKKEQIIDLSSNINFLKPKIKINFNNLDNSSYPSYKKLFKVIASNYKVKSNQIEVFNGGSSAIFTLFRHLNLKECTIYSPAYLEYKKASKIFGYKLNLINRFDDKKQKVSRNSFVIFVNPSTPDGRYYDLDKLMKYWIKQNCTIFIDESFLDFVDKNSYKRSAIKYLNSYNKLYILKSMTKFYSSAGIRIGTIISSKINIKKLKQNEPMWKLSEFDSTYLTYVLKDKKFNEESIRKTLENRKILTETLKKFSFIQKIFESDSNFLLVQLKDLNAFQLQKKLLEDKIMIRDCANFDFLDETYVRIAVKSKKNIKVLKQALEKVK